MKRIKIFNWYSKAALAVCAILLSASLQAQQVSMQVKQVMVQQAMEMLQKDYGYSVVVRTKDIDMRKLITVNEQGQDIKTVLAAILKGQDVDFTVVDKKILITKREAVADVKKSSANLIKVSGRVTDDKDSPVAGATVYVKETMTGTSTDVNGNYSLQIPANSNVTVSFIGYLTKTEAVAGRTSVDFKLLEDVAKLDEVVVVGYGVQKKSDLTGAISQISMADMETKQALSIADYLRGSVAGLNIQRSSSVSGQTAFEIRGQTSLGTNVTPLLVVDGMIYNGQLNDINPNDVETLSVMKDASSAAVYGASAASGVIIITTKQGKSEKPVIRLDAKVSIAKLFDMPEAYGVNDYLQMRGDKLINDKVPNYDKPGYFQNPYQLQGLSQADWLAYDGNINPLSDPTEIWLNRLKLYSEEKDNYYNHRSVDWLDEVFRTGVSQDYNLSVSGKSKNFNYYWSLGMLENKGVVENSYYKNIRSHINVTSDITDFLQIGMRGNLSSTDGGKQEADWAKAYDNSPLGDLMNDEGHYVRYPNSDNMGRNPLDKTQWDIMDKNINLIGAVFAKITLPLGFKFESNFNNRWRFKQGYYYKPSYTIDGSGDNGVAQRQEYKQYDWSLENILHWNKTFNDIHKVEVTLLQSAAKWMAWTTTAGASSFTTSELLGYQGIGMGGIHSVGALDEEDTKASYMARLNYSLMDRYLFTFSIRRDGYSAFGQSNPWGNFPAVAFAWRISEENFMKKAEWLSNLKLRLSYGKNGNDAIGRYAALAQLTQDYYVSDKNSTVTLYPSTMANSKLRWEETLASNIGLDMGVLGNRLSLTAELYYMKTTSMLMKRALPTITGYSSVQSNLGQVDNKGLELTLNSLNIDNQKLRWKTDVTFSLNRNKIKHLYGNMVDVLDESGNVIGQKEADDPTNGWYIGHSIDEIYGYKIDGVWQKEEEAEALAQGRVPGDYKTYMAPGSTKLSTADYQWQGYTKPRYRISMRNDFTLFGSIDISFLLRSEFGHKKANNEIAVGGYADRIAQIKYPYWTEQNPSNYWGRLGAQKTGTIYRNASFLRIEDVSVAYSFPQTWTKKLAIQNARVFMNVDNAYCFSSWIYWDPETKSPTPTTFTFGLSLTL